MLMNKERTEFYIEYDFHSIQNKLWRSNMCVWFWPLLIVSTTTNGFDDWQNNVDHFLGHLQHIQLEAFGTQQCAIRELVIPARRPVQAKVPTILPPASLQLFLSPFEISRRAGISSIYPTCWGSLFSVKRRSRSDARLVSEWVTEKSVMSVRTCVVLGEVARA